MSNPFETTGDKIKHVVLSHVKNKTRYFILSHVIFYSTMLFHIYACYSLSSHVISSCYFITSDVVIFYEKMF